MRQAQQQVMRQIQQRILQDGMLRGYYVLRRKRRVGIQRLVLPVVL